MNDILSALSTNKSLVSSKVNYALTGFSVTILLVIATPSLGSWPVCDSTTLKWRYLISGLALFKIMVYTRGAMYCIFYLPQERKYFYWGVTKKIQKKIQRYLGSILVFGCYAVTIVLLYPFEPIILEIVSSVVNGFPNDVQILR